MSKKKFTLSSDFVKVVPEQPVETGIFQPTPSRTTEKTLWYTGPKTNRVHFSSSLDANLKSEFKVWVAQQGSDMSTELEKAIKLVMKKN